MDFATDAVGAVRSDGRQITLVAARNADAIIDRANRLGAVSVDAAPVSLRELFLATVRDVGGPAGS
jgi:hypothetical protein